MSAVLELRQELEAALMGWLGTYTLANGATTPAFSVRAVGEAMTAGTRVSGIEAVLQLHPALAPARQYADEQAFGEWTLYLVDWDGSHDLTGAAQKVIALYPGTTYAEIRVPESVGPSNQLRLTVRTRQTLSFTPQAGVAAPAAGVSVAGNAPTL